MRPTEHWYAGSGSADRDTWLACQMALLRKV